MHKVFACYLSNYSWYFLSKQNKYKTNNICHNMLQIQQWQLLTEILLSLPAYKENIKNWACTFLNANIKKFLGKTIHNFYVKDIFLQRILILSSIWPCWLSHFKIFTLKITVLASWKLLHNSRSTYQWKRNNFNSVAGNNVSRL